MAGMGLADRMGRWLAPVTGIALVVLTAAAVFNPASIESEGGYSLARAGATWASGHPSVERNAPLVAARFRSTNASAVTASFGFLLLRQTNVLTR